MPQAPRNPATSQRAQDKESKRARGALSCAECRRLKLKCDKTVPCSSCKRRGCSAICPNGSLITGQGTRFVLADTEKLHNKISQMSDRIRQLEDSLAILQTTQSSEPHPLLHRDLLKIKSSLELHSASLEGEEQPTDNENEENEDSQVIDSFGTLAIRDDGAATFFGRSAGQESLLIGEVSAPFLVSSPSRGSNGDSPSVSLGRSFPFSSTLYSQSTTIDQLVEHLPPWPEASRLSMLYLEQSPWFFGAVTEKQLREESLPMWYHEAAKIGPLPSQSPEPPGFGLGGAHDLAVLFMIFCFGALTDMELPAAPDNEPADKYYQLTKATLNLEPILERPPSVATVQTLSLMAIYEGLCSTENSIESTWALMGLATKLAQSIGLHRDGARWKLPPAEVQKRRALFWELFITDAWQSLATGRLATFSLPFVDCELPFDSDKTIANDGTPQPSFPYWKARFGAECVSAVVQGTLTSRAPKYSIILELDRKVRDMELPLYAQGPPPEGAGLAQTMSHFMPTNYRELTLLYIHRCFFAHAISSNPIDPLKSTYAPSFLAGYRSACSIIKAVKQQFELFPAQIARFWVLWTHAFSASVMLASVPSHSPQSNVAPAALLELKMACELFQSASAYGGRAVKFLPILKRLQAKAQQTFRDTNSGIPPAIHNDIFKPSMKEESKDELSIFSGQTHTMATKTTPTHRSKSSPQANNAIASSSRGSSGSPQQSSPQQSFADNPSFVGVHPSLVSELHGFSGQIKKQIQTAYQANSELFAGTMIVDPPSQSQLAIQQEQNRQQFQLQLERQELERLELERQRLERHKQEHREVERREQQRQDMERRERQHAQLLQQRADQQRIQFQVDQTHQFHQGYGQSQPVSASSSSSHIQDASMAPPGPIPVSHTLPHESQSRIHSGLRHSHSRSGLHQSYQQQPHIVPSQHYSLSPPDYSSPTSATSPVTHYTPPSTSYGGSQVHDSPASGFLMDTYQYWPAAPGAFSMPSSQVQQGHRTSVHPQAFQHNPHYTPEGALKGIAADDHSLQETWQSYMHKMSSPRHLLED